MRGLWALPALVRLTVASQHSFSVHDDLLAFPQYRVVFTESGISEEHAAAFFASTKERDDASSPTTAELAHTTDGGAPNPFKGAVGDDTEGEDEVAATYERMVLDSYPYLCRIPIVETEDDNTNASSNARDPVEEEKELARASDRGWELLRGMQDNCIYFLSGWWSYSFCYNKGVKQFHQLPPGRGVPMYPPVEDESVHSFILGKFPKDKKQKKNQEVDDEGHGSDEGSATGETSVAKLETKGETRYLVQKLTGGTTCDLTGKDRKIEVQFHCHPNTPDRIGMIKEVSTCAYLMVIYTPRLCNDVAFLPPQENRAHHIACALIQSSTDAGLSQSTTKPKDNEPSIEEIQALLGHDGQNEGDISAAVLEALGYGAAASMPVIGGTVVGAQALVGSPGKVIEKSVVVGGGKETLLATVAESDGRGNQKVMSAEQLRKLDIKDPKDVDDLRKRLGNMAGDRGWKLELVNTPRGREFRGILLDGDEDEGEDEGTAQEKGEAEGIQGSEEEYRQEDEGQGSEETFFKEEL
ncbi:uncharacterized protein K452DRAFT_314730 [Aplosporella prunicola CBS 121167]|uniref:Endoplasmic reticulum lectin n=1 Tax=Aplosporella prunicola CBS 121167 TaxID=1176127 RepID=A0A6A6BQT2_9PEZI|nr:uncharacterized protein K452DRAFT_314730 [Aplosporella prunicola CBS 121167]KAF2146446.1 hypothetical protein K452DRAFT_314730 [Aplosporella prunicola CBS 121167]